MGQDGGESVPSMAQCSQNHSTQHTLGDEAPTQPSSINALQSAPVCFQRAVGDVLLTQLVESIADQVLHGGDVAQRGELEFKLIACCKQTNKPSK